MTGETPQDRPLPTDLSTSSSGQTPRGAGRCGRVAFRLRGREAGRVSSFGPGTREAAPCGRSIRKLKRGRPVLGATPFLLARRVRRNHELRILDSPTPFYARPPKNAKTGPGPRRGKTPRGRPEAVIEGACRRFGAGARGGADARFDGHWGSTLLFGPYVRRRATC